MVKLNIISKKLYYPVPFTFKMLTCSYCASSTAECYMYWVGKPFGVGDPNCCDVCADDEMDNDSDSDDD